MLLMKTSENIFIFSPVFYLIIKGDHESPKEFLKNSQIANTRAGFLRQTSPETMHFQAWKKEDCQKNDH